MGLSYAYGQAQVAASTPATLSWARLEYTGHYDDSYIKNWYTDWPDMDTHLVTFVNRLTNITADVATVKPSSKDLFKYPLIYVVEPEQMNLSDADASHIREYLKRGGFMFMDDFHGDAELEAATKNIAQILGYEPILLRLDTRDELFHVFYDINKIEQVVNDSIVSCAQAGCEQWENGPSGRDPHVYAIYDERGRMIVLMAYNTDLGDGLEWADVPWYPHEQSTYAIKMLTNVIIYSITH